MKYILLIVLFLFSCTKEQSTTIQSPQGPTFIKIQAVDKDGKIQESEIVLVR